MLGLMTRVRPALTLEDMCWLLGRAVPALVATVRTSPHPAGLPPLLSLQLSPVWGDAKGTACSNPLCRPRLSRPPTLSQSSEVPVSQL